MANDRVVEALLASYQRELWHIDENAGSLGSESAAFLNAMPGFETVFDFEVHCEQKFKPDYDALIQNGANVVPRLEPGAQHYRLVLVRLSRSNTYNQLLIFRACELAGPDGLVVVAGEKRSGIAPLYRQLQSQVELSERWSKYHCVVFWFNPGTWDFSSFKPKKANHRAGLFSADAPDPGSVMLTQHFDKKIYGKVADFGAGWGYLSQAVLNASPNITSLDLYEADHDGVLACQYLLNQEHSSLPISIHWHDVANTPIRERFDWVIMNPPFHKDGKTVAELGRSFIKRAASRLAPGGKLLMVANRQLAYEASLNGLFSSYEKLEENNLYKVLYAIK